MHMAIHYFILQPGGYSQANLCMPTLLQPLKMAPALQFASSHKYSVIQILALFGTGAVYPIQAELWHLLSINLAVNGVI